LIKGLSANCSFDGLSSLAHSPQEKVTLTSTFSNATGSYHHVNTLYDNTINCLLMLAKSIIALNETFSYKQSLEQTVFHKFTKAVMVEVRDHKSRGH
jgi:hypothetical protein